MDERAKIEELLAGLGVAREDVPTEPWEAVQLASDAVIARGEHLTAADIATEVGISSEEVRDTLALLGIEVADTDLVCFTSDDLELVRFLHNTLGGLFLDDEGGEVLRVAANSLAALAEAGVVGYVQGPERRLVGDGADAEPNALEHLELNRLIAETGLDLARHLGTVFRHHLRQASERNRQSQNYDDRNLARLAVGFVDLVGFTALSQELETSELIGLIRSLEQRAHELAHRHQTRIAKLIGDEVMLVAVEASDAAAFMRDLIASFDSEGVVPRGGLVFGDVINIHGDYFGSVVNLAARLVDAAVPGEVLVDGAVADDQRIATEPAGRRMLKGFADPVQVHTML